MTREQIPPDQFSHLLQVMAGVNNQCFWRRFFLVNLDTYKDLKTAYTIWKGRVPVLNVQFVDIVEETINDILSG